MEGPRVRTPAGWEVRLGSPCSGVRRGRARAVAQGSVGAEMFWKVSRGLLAGVRRPRRIVLTHCRARRGPEVLGGGRLEETHMHTHTG